MHSRPYKEKRYLIMVLDEQGAMVRRTTLLRRQLRLAAMTLAAGFMLLLFFVVHGFLQRPAAEEAELVARDNLELRGILRDLEKNLPGVRQQLLSAEQTAAQLWTTSGLGMTTNLLGIGPLDGDQRWGLPDEAAPYTGSILDTPYVGLSLETDRILSHGEELHQQLGETLEYFNDARRLLSNTPSVRPVRTPITSRFGKRRDPIMGAWVMHKGLDLGGHTGLEIMAPADGVVIWTGWRGGYGQTVVIDHGYNMQTHFAHLDGYRVKQGQRVRRGDVIAEMGTTGRSTGPHLHYEVRRLGQPLDPQRFILD